MVGPRPFLVKSLKGDWDQKCFQDNTKFCYFFNSYLQNFIHFSFAKFQLVLIARFGNMVV